MLSYDRLLVSKLNLDEMDATIDPALQQRLTKAAASPEF